ncbi:MAG: hypothetical protein GKR94_18475 [Gammaproteobacteria bacterium]|nr:hypothetical protein [Gammaproteobacteria bacterium]
MTLDELRGICHALAGAGVEYVLIGGAALNVHGIVRATEDIDLMVRPDADNIGRLRNALHRLWDDPSIDEITADDLLGDYPVVRYAPPGGELYLDIVARLGDAWAFDDIERQRVNIAGMDVYVAAPASLYQMKKDTVRSLDKSDAQALRVKFKLDEQ